MSDTTATTFPVLSVLDPLEFSMQQVEKILACQVDGWRSPLEAALANLISCGGKRMRPMICLLVGNMLGAESNPLLHMAAAVEMLHTATLVHDDLVDGSALRRGIRTLNSRWPAAATVLAGDYAFTQAARLVLGTGCMPAIDLFTATMSCMVAGELAHLTQQGDLPGQEAYFNWIRAKTASLFELAAGAAAMLRPVDAGSVWAARLFGEKIGMAFQIVDDVLDFTSHPNELGKPVGHDLATGVLTLPALLYLEAHPADPDLHAITCGEKLPGPALDHLLARICTSGTLAASLDMARTFIREGLKAADTFPESPERSALEALAWSVVERKK
jgi:geranylgeranyl pyrophosphate synthase